MKLLETIRFENGRFANLELHQKRMNVSRKVLFNFETAIDLEKELSSRSSVIENPASPDFQIANLKELEELSSRSRSSGFAIRTQSVADLQSAKYGIKNPESPDFQIANLKEPDLSGPLQASALEGLFKCRIIYSKQIEEIEFIPYQLPQIQSLKMVLDDKLEYSRKYLNRSRLDKLFSQKGNNDDILIVKNGLITDTSFANILFFNGKQWLTPNQPLLKGTQRQFLLEREQIVTADIRPDDVNYFQKARLINAMIRFGDEMDVEIKKIS